MMISTLLAQLLIPFGTDRKPLRTPWVTYWLVATNVVIYLWSTISLDHQEYQATVQALGFVPAQAEWYSLLTSMFLHDSPMPFHLTFNMIFLWLFGQHVEDALGHAVFAVFYLGSQLSASLLHMVMTSTFTPYAAATPCIGASGAIAGVLGLYAVRFYYTRVRIFYFLTFFLRGAFEVSSVIALGVWLSNELLGGMISVYRASGVAHWAHIGGFLFGMMASVVMGLGTEAKGASLSQEATSWGEAGNWSAAAKQWEELLRREPRNARAHVELGHCYHMMDRANESIQKFERAIQLYLASKNGEAALWVYHDLKRYQPGCLFPPDLQFRMGGLLEKAGLYQEAVQSLSPFLTVYARHSLAETAWVRYGQILLNKLDQPARALEVFELMLQKYPHSHWRDFARQARRKLAEEKGEQDATGRDV